MLDVTSRLRALALLLGGCLVLGVGLFGIYCAVFRYHRDPFSWDSYWQAMWLPWIVSTIFVLCGLGFFLEGLRRMKCRK